MKCTCNAPIQPLLINHQENTNASDDALLIDSSLVAVSFLGASARIIIVVILLLSHQSHSLSRAMMELNPKYLMNDVTYGR